MIILHKEENNKGIFYIEENGVKVAELTYKRTPDNKIVADHTWVTPEKEGQGIAGKLFNELIVFLRKENLKLIPLCSYVVAKTKKEEFKDLLA